MKIFIGQKVRHKEIDNGRETCEVVGIRKEEVELWGDLSNGRANNHEVQWFSIKGLIFQNMWGRWIDPDDDFFERITKNAGPRD
jgi:hypothetical protein